MIYTSETLERKYLNGETSKCISVNGARIIIPTSCTESVSFTNPDDLEPSLLVRWKNGERGPEFENQKLNPGDALVMYNNGRDFNKLLNEVNGWHTSPQGIKDMIERLYSCADVGAKMDEPAIWNSDLNWAKSVALTTTRGQPVTESLWQAKAGKALEVIKNPMVQDFVMLSPGDVVWDRNKQKQVAGAMSAIAVRQPDATWNIVQLNAKGYRALETNEHSVVNTAYLMSRMEGRR